MFKIVTLSVCTGAVVVAVDVTVLVVVYVAVERYEVLVEGNVYVKVKVELGEIVRVVDTVVD